MWVVHVVLIIILAVAAFMFVSLNSGRIVDIISLGFGDYTDVPLNLVVLESFLFGALWALVVFLFIQISTRLRISRLKKTIGRMQEELDSLRTIPLEDISITEDEE